MKRPDQLGEIGKGLYEKDYTKKYRFRNATSNKASEAAHEKRTAKDTDNFPWRRLLNT
jgi:hypothetical protein